MIKNYIYIDNEKYTAMEFVECFRGIDCYNSETQYYSDNIVKHDDSGFKYIANRDRFGKVQTIPINTPVTNTLYWSILCEHEEITINNILYAPSNNIEVLAQTEYQDLYRITDGVLLVVNKFIPIDYSDKTDRCVTIWFPHVKYKTYNKGCQKELKQLKEDYYDEYVGVKVEKGTVIYNSKPVVKTDDKSKWKYEVKTTGSALGGNNNVVKEILDNILKIIANG